MKTQSNKNEEDGGLKHLKLYFLIIKIKKAYFNIKMAGSGLKVLLVVLSACLGGFGVYLIVQATSSYFGSSMGNIMCIPIGILSILTGAAGVFFHQKENLSSFSCFYILQMLHAIFVFIQIVVTSAIDEFVWQLLVAFFIGFLNLVVGCYFAKHKKITMGGDQNLRVRLLQ